MPHAVRVTASGRLGHGGGLARLGVTAAIVSVTLAAALSGATLLSASSVPAAPRDSAGAGGTHAATGRATVRQGTSHATSFAAAPSGTPRSVRIPAIDLETNRIVALGRAPSGAMEVPADAGTIGWWRTAVSPGSRDVTILSGHRELGYTSGVFHALPQLRPGDTVRVTRADDTVASFSVYRLERTRGVVRAARLAASPSRQPELRLITWARHSPDERARTRSLVVFAALRGLSDSAVTPGQ